MEKDGIRIWVFREEKLERRRNGQVFIPAQARAGRNMAFLLAPFTMVPRTDFTFHRMDLHHKCKGGHGNDHPVFSWMKHLRQNIANPCKGDPETCWVRCYRSSIASSRILEISERKQRSNSKEICNCCISIS